MKTCSEFLFFFLLTLSPMVHAGKTYDYEVIHQETAVTVKNHKLTEHTELLIQINTKAGEHAAEFELDYSPSLKITNLTAWIQDTTGQIIRKLEKKEIHDRSEFSYITFYSDYKIKCFELKYNRFPYQVHVEYDYETIDFEEVARWSPIYKSSIPTRSATLTVEIPVDYPVHILRQKIASPVIDTMDQTIRYSWTDSYLRLIKQETCRQSFNDLSPFILIVPSEFSYGTTGSYASWVSFGDYFDDLMQDQGTLPLSEINTVKLLTSGMQDTVAIIRKLYQYLQDNTRYVNVSVDFGGWKPYPAAYVALNKYGDCKALSVYMKSLLEVVGIQSFYTLVEANEIPGRMYTDFPAPQFNHAILCVPSTSDTLWLDCTMKEVPAGYTPAWIRGRPALLVSKGNSKLANIPPMQAEDVAVSHTFHYEALTNEITDVAIRSTYRGPDFEKIAFYGAFAEPERKEDLARELIPFSNYELVKYAFTRKSSSDVAISFDAQIKVNDLVKILNDRMIITLPAVGIPTFEKIQSRENPVFFPNPAWIRDTMIIAIPAGMDVKSFPAAELTCEMGSYKVRSSLVNNNMVYIRDFRLERGLFELEKYPALYNWASAIHTFERQNKIIFSQHHE